MKVDTRELLFIKENAPSGFIKMLVDNTGKSRNAVNNELRSIKEDYSDVIITEARRLLKAIKGVEFSSAPEEANTIPL